MTRSTYVFGFLALALMGLAGCSSTPPAKPAATASDKIQGKAQVMLDETGATDTALNAGGPSVYLIVDGFNRYRLFFNKPFEVQAGQEYIAEGVYAQKAIEAIGDPDQGKNGYPLGSSCDRVVNMAWPGLAMDAAESYSSSLRVKVQRFPARPVFLVTKIEPATGAKPKDAVEKEAPTVTVPADKQRALLVEGATALPAPLWEPAGGTVHCKVVIDEQGKIAELASGSQLCETVPWVQLRYKPTVKGGHAVRVNTEVEVRFDPRK
jgi:hypothetical protein